VSPGKRDSNQFSGFGVQGTANNLRQQPVGRTFITA